jgi:synaptojanin
MFIDNNQYLIRQTLQSHGVFTYINAATQSLQKGVFRINCIDCLDRTNSVQLGIGLTNLLAQLESLNKRNSFHQLREQLKVLWINNGDHISRIYTGTGALGQQNKVNFPIDSAMSHSTIDVEMFDSCAYDLAFVN